MDDTKIAECKSCGSEIVWMKTRNDKNICVDLPPIEDPLRDEVLEATLFDRTRFKTHFETCPHAEQHRKSRDRSTVAPEERTPGDGHVLAKKLNIALKTLEDIAKSSPDGMRSVEIAKAGIKAVHDTR